MPKLVVHRTGNSLGLPIPHAVVRELGLAPGDELMVHLERVPALSALAGRLKGRITADEFTQLSNEGEDLG
jgi:antitoxin component of MazEF toxin-antitoxin module